MGEVTVRDWMQTGVFVCRPDTPATEVAAAMARRDISAVVVVDDDRHVVGVVSRTDLASVAGLGTSLEPWRGLTARSLMSSPVVTVRPSTPVLEAARVMRQREIHRVVVTEVEAGGERPIGILSLTDLLRNQAASGSRRKGRRRET